MSNSIKTQVMCLAHQLRKQGLSLSKALSTAWKAVKVVTSRLYSFSFWKVSTGEQRNTGVIKYAKIEGILLKFLEINEGVEQWRSCRIETII